MEPLTSGYKRGLNSWVVASIITWDKFPITLEIIKVMEKLLLFLISFSSILKIIEINFGYTKIDTTDRNVDSIISEVIKKKTWGEGITMPLDYRRNRMLISIKQFFSRGFKRI